MISTNTLIYLGLLLGGWAIRHWLPPASASTPPSAPPQPQQPPAQPQIPLPQLPVAPLPNTATAHPILNALFTQGGVVIDAALHDWLANGLPAIAQPNSVLPASAQHPVVAAANQVAAQAAKVASANAMNQVVAGLQTAAAGPAASVVVP